MAERSASQRILMDIESAMNHVKQHAKRSALKSSSMEGAMNAIDRTAEMMYIVECEKLNRIYRITSGRCKRCNGKKKCTDCSGTGKKVGLIVRRCSACKGTGVCHGCIARSDEIIETLKRAAIYARLRENLSFEDTMKRMGIRLNEAAIYQGIANIARER